MFSQLFIIWTAVVVAVSAQGTSTSDASPAAPSDPTLGTTTSGASSAAPSDPTLDPSGCIQNCLTSAASQTECGTVTNVTCECTSIPFQQNVATCFGLCGNATALQDALASQIAKCSALGLGPTGLIPTGTGGSMTSVPIPTAIPNAGTGGSIASISIPTASSPTNGASSAGSPSSPATSAASSSTPSSAAGGLVANGGVAALMALIAGFLAI